MTTPKKYTSVTRIGVTAEFTEFPTSIAPYINSACKCTIVARLDCGECGNLTFYRSKR